MASMVKVAFTQEENDVLSLVTLAAGIMGLVAPEDVPVMVRICDKLIAASQEAEHMDAFDMLVAEGKL